MNRKTIPLLFALVLAAATWWIWNTTSALSGPIATQFGSGGRAQSFMGGDFYRWFMLSFTVALPILVAGAVAGLPRLAPGFTNIPNRSYWLAPQRREKSLQYLADHGLWLGLLMTLFGCAIHWLVLQANTLRPPRLDMPLFWIVLAGFVICAGIWAWTLILRFREPVDPA